MPTIFYVSYIALWVLLLTQGVLILLIYRHFYLLAFVSPSCGPCVKILPTILQMARVLNQIEVILITDGKRERALQLVEQFHPPTSIVCIAGEGSGLAHAYQVRVSPFTFLIGKDGRILAKSLCDSTARLQYLLDAAGLELPSELLEPTPQLLQVKTK